MEKSSIYLQERNSGSAVEAELWDEISDEHVGMWTGTWLPLIQSAIMQFRSDNTPHENWPQDLHWNWDKKTTLTRHLLSLRRFAITCGKELQGLMLVNLTKMTGKIASQVGKDLAYIEFLSTAPWNRPALVAAPTYGGVGSVLINAAIQLSQAEGFRGRIGLHSLSQAATFYRDRCGMTDFGPDSTHHDLTYFEMDESQAAAFINEKNTK